MAFTDCENLRYQVSERERLLIEKTESYQRKKQKTRLLRYCISVVSYN